MDRFSSKPESGYRRVVAPRKRPTRAYRPALGVERFEERTLLSVSLVSVNAAGTTSSNSD